MEILKDKELLLVDDDNRNSFALGNYLESLQMKVLLATNGQEAISILKGGTRPAVVLLDMMMPVMDGYEALAILKEDPSLRHIPVIALTARAMIGDREKCIEAGAWDYISKPVDLKLLLEKIAKYIQ